MTLHGYGSAALQRDGAVSVDEVDEGRWVVSRSKLGEPCPPQRRGARGKQSVAKIATL